MAGVLSRLYTGTGAFDIVGRRRLWYAIFGAIVLVCVGSIVLRGFNLGVDFTGGTLVQFPAAGTSAPVDVESVRGVFERVVGTEPTVQVAGSGAAQAVLIRSETLDAAQLVALKQALFDLLQPIGASGQPALDAISDSAVSGSWGSTPRVVSTSQWRLMSKPRSVGAIRERERFLTLGGLRLRRSRVTQSSSQSHTSTKAS